MNNAWQTIDESLSDAPIVLVGIPAVGPEAYERLDGPSRRFSIGSIAYACWRFISWSASGLAHLLLVILLIGIVIGKRSPDDSTVNVGTNSGKAGFEGKAMKTPGPAETPEEEKKAEKKDEPVEPEKPKVEPKKEETVVKSDEDAKTPDPNSKTETPDPKEDNSSIGGGESGTGKTTKNEDNTKAIEKDPTEALKAKRAGTIAKLREGGDKQIVIVGGAYDRVEEVLSRLEIPYTKIEPEKLGAHDLSKCLVLLVNCHTAYAAYAGSSSTPEQMKEESEKIARRIEEVQKLLDKAKRNSDILKYRGEIATLTNQKQYYDRMHEYLSNNKKMVENVRTFVEKGGYLFTSDWGITLLEKVFPGMVKNGGNVGPKTVTIAPKKGQEGHAFLQEVFTGPARKGGTTSTRTLRWEIDSSSYLIKIVSTKVETIVESSQLPNHRAVAVVFSPEKGEKPGKVLHVLSHFYRQADNFGEYALQNLMLNFLVDRILGSK